jgi:hypothetical protein
LYPAAHYLPALSLVLLFVVAIEKMQEFLFALSTCLAFLGGLWCVAHQRPIRFLQNIPLDLFFILFFCFDEKKHLFLTSYVHELYN